MIVGIGIDAVDISRLSEWHTYSDKKLSRIFSSQEIAYCLSSQPLSAARFAVRFAAREALFKALSSACPGQVTSLLAVCRATHIRNTPAPSLYLDFKALSLERYQDRYSILISLSHTNDLATAMILIQDNQHNDFGKEGF